MAGSAGIICHLTLARYRGYAAAASGLLLGWDEALLDDARRHAQAAADKGSDRFAVHFSVEGPDH